MNPAKTNWFHDTVSALAYSLARPHEQRNGLRPPHNDLTQFILTQHAQMPDYLQTPIKFATLVFDLFGVFRAGNRYHRQSAEVRARQIAGWKDSGIGFQRDLIRYFESLVLLALYSRGSSRLNLSTDVATSLGAAGLRTCPANELRAEIIVIGSGPGGAITACLLAEAGRDVLLIEEGPDLPPSSCEPFSRSEMLQKYRNGGQTAALGRNKIAYVEGRCVGGGSEVNSGLYHRTPPDMLERWQKDFQVDALGESDLFPHFEACEQDLSVSLLPYPAPQASLKLHEGASRLGWRSLEVPRWFRYDDKGDGKRQSMTQTFIPRFLTAGGKLLANARALRLRQNGLVWTVDAQHRSSGAIRLSAEQVFLCAGAVHSAALLRRSGITRNIGNSLRVHPTVKIVARFPEEVNAADLGVPVHQVKEFAPRLSFGCSISSPAYVAMGLIDHPEAAATTSENWKHTAVYYAMITSEGAGTVRNIPGYRDPLVRYTLTEGDRRNLADGYHKLARALFASGAAALYPSLTRGPALHCEGCLRKLPEVLPDGLANLMTIHLSSSCPMGEAKTKCASNSFGRVHGFRNLFVNDASLLCTAPGVNPQGSIMALARRNVLNFLGKL